MKTFHTLDTFSAILDAEIPSRIEDVTEIQDNDGKLLCYAEPSQAGWLADCLNELSALRESHAKLVEALQFYAEEGRWQEAETGIGMFPAEAIDYGSTARKALYHNSLTSQQKPRDGHPGANAGVI